MACCQKLILFFVRFIFKKELVMKLQRRFAMGVAALVVSLSFGLSSAQAQKVLTVGNPFSPLSLDPSLSGNGRAGTHLMPAYEPLVRERADGSLEPALAASWKVAPDNKEVTFTLRKDAKFSDGLPVNAAAVKKSVEYWRNKKGPFTANFLTVTSIDVLDEFRVSVKMSQPQPSIVGLFSAYWLAGDIISPKAIDTPEILGAQTFGAGPYKLDPSATITRKSYTYVKNEHYYDKKRQHWDKVVMTVFEDQNSAVQSLKAGQTKVLVSDPLTGNANAESLPKEFRLISDPVQWTGLILLDRDGIINPVMKDVRVRQAINMALNRPLIGRALFGKFIDPSVQMQGKGFMGYDAANEDKYPYSLEKAKALLAQAGHPNGVNVTIAYVNNSLSVTLSQAIAAQLKRAGINVKTHEYQNFGVMNASMAKKEHEILLFNSNFGPPNLARFQTLMPKGSLNFYATEDAELTKLISDASQLSLNKAEGAWKKAYARVVDLAWFAPVGATHTVYFAHESVKMPKPGASLVVDLVNMEPVK
jgi:peptide/nickel transport system substrate-binding protein